MIDDERRAVDYAMGVVARTWGHFEDFKNNMRARQPEVPAFLRKQGGGAGAE